MVNWVDGSTFNKLNVIDRQYFYNDELNPNWLNQELNYAEFQGLYEYFFNGAEIMHRANANGKLELLILINDIDPIILAKSKLGIKVVENENNRFIFHLLIWDNEDSPLEVPFIFQLKDSVQRYHIAAFCEQESIPIYFLKSENKTLYVSFSREMFLPDKIRYNMREAVLLAYTQEEGVDTLSNEKVIIASSINFEELTSSGWAYQFDVSVLEKEYTQEGVKEYLFEIINKAALVLGKSKYKDIQKVPFYFWFTQKDNVFGASGENGSAQILFITPFYNDRATRVRSTIDPLYDYIKTTVGFIRVESGNPIYENSLPLFMYSNGELTRIQVDEYFLEDAATFQEIIMRNLGLMSDDYFSIYKMFLNS